MSVELTPSGTRGQRTPGGFLKGLFLGLSRLAHRLGLTKQMDGFPVIMLTTRGEQSRRFRGYQGATDREIPVIRLTAAE